uniref:Uncharacterized protein n=1 Tax=Leersia perrieri TaxID=77586 RepID=A0A0D9VD79_9ORYZ
MRPVAANMAIGGVATASKSVPVMPTAAVAPPPFWSTPTPYLFMGFGVVMALIAVALAVLLCSRRKEGGSGGDDVIPPGMMSVRVLAPVDRESAAPRVVVVMAGDDSPSRWRRGRRYSLSFLLASRVKPYLRRRCRRLAPAARHTQSSGGGGDDVIPPGMMSVRVLAPVDREAAAPRVVVVMGGDDSPSFLASATPLAAFAATGVPMSTKVAAPQAGVKDGAAV